MIPIIITARKQSKRCSDKLLRPFYKTDSLLDICLKKLQGNKNAYLAGHEQEFKDIAIKYSINFIQRTEESALSEDAITIHSHLKDKFGLICQLNPCCPLVKTSTIFDAIDSFAKLNAKSLFSVKETNDLVFNSDKMLINTDRVFNSKIRRPNYIGNNVIYIYDTNAFFSTGSYWAYEKDDPNLYVMSAIESIDIDTELDFKIAQTIYVDNL